MIFTVTQGQDFGEIYRITAEEAYKLAPTSETLQ